MELQLPLSCGKRCGFFFYQFLESEIRSYLLKIFHIWEIQAIIIIMNFIKVSCLIAQAQCLTNWGGDSRPYCLLSFIEC